MGEETREQQDSRRRLEIYARENELLIQEKEGVISCFSDHGKLLFQAHQNDFYKTLLNALIYINNAYVKGLFHKQKEREIGELVVEMVGKLGLKEEEER